MELSKFKLPKFSSNFLIWAVVIFIVIGFGSSSRALGFNYFNVPDNKPGGSRKHYPGGKGNIVPAPKGGIFPVAAPVGTGGFLGGNGLFLIAVIAVLYLTRDDKKKDSKFKSEAEYCDED